MVQGDRLTYGCCEKRIPKIDGPRSVNQKRWELVGDTRNGAAMANLFFVGRR